LAQSLLQGRLIGTFTFNYTRLWDGAPYHRAQLVKTAAEALDIELAPLPAYSLDFMPIERLWQWLREDVTYLSHLLRQADRPSGTGHTL
jgi:transposase